MRDPGLRNPERRLANAMRDAPGRSWDVATILDACDWQDQAVATGAAVGLVDHGLASQQEEVRQTVNLGPAGQAALEHGLLEARLLEWIMEREEASMADLQGAFERQEAGPGVGLLKALGVRLDGGVFHAGDAGTAMKEIEARTAFLRALPASLSDLDAAMLEHFRRRREFVQVDEEVHRTWTATPALGTMEEAFLLERESIGDLTPELLQQGLNWDEVDLRRFDVTLSAAMPTMGRSHPMQALIDRIRTIFLEMGFSELVDDYVQTAGWNMDALFLSLIHI